MMLFLKLFIQNRKQKNSSNIWEKIHELMAFSAWQHHQAGHNTAVLLLSKKKWDAFQALRGQELECFSVTATQIILSNIKCFHKKHSDSYVPFSVLIQNLKQ
jgi:hypothetical protein